MRSILATLVFLFVFTGQFANAGVVESAPSGFVLSYEATVPNSPDRAFQALGQLPRWWNSEHTYSGDAPRFMHFDLRAGACLCERWQGNSVEHARVIVVLNENGGRTVRLAGAFGPLQGLTTNAIMTFTIVPAPQGAKITMTYRVSGELTDFAELAAPVDHVLSEQFSRLIRYTVGQAPS